MKKIAAVLAVIFTLVLVGSAVWPFPNFGTSGTPESITLGVSHGESSSLIYIAENQGFFTENGLNVTIKDDDSGLISVKRLLNDEVDVALTSEFALVGNAFKKENISAIGGIDKFESLFLACPKDRGIINVSDLKGKKIGLTRGALPEFYLGRFLDLHGMSIKDVTLVNLPRSQYVDAFTNGSVDAIVTPSMFIDQIQERLGSNVVLWPVQNNQKGHWLLTCREGWASSHPEQINRLLKAIVQAEDYAINHPAEAKAIVQKRLNYTDERMAQIWPENQFSLMLDQSLLIAMNDEGLWMIRNNLTNEKTLPDFSNYIYTQGLREVKPDAVNIR